ncbi:unnamed protein product [Lepeophtheirus salmonis]|uniref:(salmon louse) hypothetical protein n=1 Tax=Lepeophtheirus salmonis TaxID=72036 RepID=A0A7R8H7H1_LEPSM|nr:unnamed protein product [Lepeophtheirus salmonis]CAF2918371.1 unnamed protein product [Lepeophtheirus salmonis]
MSSLFITLKSIKISSGISMRKLKLSRNSYGYICRKKTNSFSQERFWQAKFERLRSAHAEELKNLLKGGSHQKSITVNGDTPEMENEENPLEKEKLTHDTSFELDIPRSKLIEKSKIIIPKPERKSSMEIPLKSNYAPSPKETLDESLISLGISPKSTGIDTYTFIKSMKTLGDKLNRDDDVEKIVFHSSPSESGKSSVGSTLPSGTKSPSHFGHELEIPHNYESHEDLTQHERFTRTKPWTSIKNSNSFRYQGDPSLVVEGRRRQGIYASDSELLKRGERSKGLLSSISPRDSAPLQSYSKVREANMELKKSGSIIKSEFNFIPFSETFSEKKGSGITDRGGLLQSNYQLRLLDVSSLKKKDSVENNEEEHSFSTSCSRNDSIESPSLHSEDTEYDIDEDNNSCSSPRAIKIKPPRPGSKIDVLKSIIEGQMKKNRSSLSINEECGDLDEDEEVGMESFSESDLNG